MLVVNLPQNPYVVLACNDCTLRVINEQGKLIYSTTLDSAVLSIAPIIVEIDTEVRDSIILAYGLKNGKIGTVEIGIDEAILLWEFDYPQGKSEAPIQKVHVAKLRENQAPDLIALRDDGEIEIYKFGISRQGGLLG